MESGIRNTCSIPHGNGWAFLGCSVIRHAVNYEKAAFMYRTAYSYVGRVCHPIWRIKNQLGSAVFEKLGEVTDSCACGPPSLSFMMLHYMHLIPQMNIPSPHRLLFSLHSTAPFPLFPELSFNILPKCLRHQLPIPQITFHQYFLSSQRRGFLPLHQLLRGYP